MQNNHNQTNQMKPDAKARDARLQTADEKANSAKAKTNTGSKSGSGKSDCGC